MVSHVCACVCLCSPHPNYILGRAPDAWVQCSALALLVNGAVHARHAAAVHGPQHVVVLLYVGFGGGCQCGAVKGGVALWYLTPRGWGSVRARTDAMLRIFKTYHFGADSNGLTMQMSSYPGLLSSTDDFYQTSSGLVVMETTNVRLVWLCGQKNAASLTFNHSSLPRRTCSTTRCTR